METRYISSPKGNCCVDIVYLKRLILISTVGTLIIPAGTEHHGRSKRNQLDP